MAERVLVAYATKTGSTTGVAEAIGAKLVERGFEVDVKPLCDCGALEGYDDFVLGSAVNGGQWLPDAVAFVDNNRDVLSQRPVALFCVHAMNAGDAEKATRRRHAYLDKVRPLVSPVDEAYFLGQGPTSAETSGFARWAFRAFGGAGEGDLRDWEAIDEWAGQVLFH